MYNIQYILNCIEQMHESDIYRNIDKFHHLLNDSVIDGSMEFIIQNYGMYDNVLKFYVEYGKKKDVSFKVDMLETIAKYHGYKDVLSEHMNYNLAHTIAHYHGYHPILESYMDSSLIRVIITQHRSIKNIERFIDYDDALLVAKYIGYCSKIKEFYSDKKVLRKLIENHGYDPSIDMYMDRELAEIYAYNFGYHPYLRDFIDLKLLEICAGSSRKPSTELLNLIDEYGNKRVRRTIVLHHGSKKYLSGYIRKWAETDDKLIDFVLYWHKYVPWVREVFIK